jgi:hypothetical protein
MLKFSFLKEGNFHRIDIQNVDAWKCGAKRPVEGKSVQECIFIPFKTRAIWREPVSELKVDATNHSSRTQYTTQFSISELDLESFFESVQKVFTEHKS